MGISSHEFLRYVIQPTLQQLDENAAMAQHLLLATASFQSGLGKQLQRNQGIGVYGITADQHTEVWDRYLAQDCDLASQIRGMASQHEFPKAPHTELLTNLSYATAITLMMYRYHGVKIPDTHDPAAFARCWAQTFLDCPPTDQENADFVCHYLEMLAKDAATRLAA